MINTNAADLSANLATNIVAKNVATKTFWGISGNHGSADAEVIGGCEDGPRIYLTGLEGVVSVIPWIGIGCGFCLKTPEYRPQ